MKIFLYSVLFLFIAGTNYCQSWKLIWSDEFDGPTLNTSNWSYEIGTGTNGWGNNELQYYTNRPENIKIENGELVITARQESYGGRNYTSARIKTQGKRSFKYGRIEAYIKIPIGQGSWPAFWTLGNDITSVGWPKCGEIDIMEHVNNQTVTNGVMHWDNNGHASYGGTTQIDVSQYHLYAIEWNSSQIKWYVDLKPFHTANILNGINSTSEFHNPHFIILNLAIGGNWPGSPNGTMTFPITYNIDYVRVYELATDIKEEEKIPSGFSLMQNYPNPFNPSTTICYQIPVVDALSAAEVPVTLKVYDFLGREVETLVDEYKSPGFYSSFFVLRSSLASGVSAKGGYASGVYFYTLRAGNYSSTRKMILMR